MSFICFWSLSRCKWWTKHDDKTWTGSQKDPPYLLIHRDAQNTPFPSIINDTQKSTVVPSSLWDEGKIRPKMAFLFLSHQFGGLGEYNANKNIRRQHALMAQSWSCVLSFVLKGPLRWTTCRALFSYIKVFIWPAHFSSGHYTQTHTHTKNTRTHKHTYLLDFLRINTFNCFGLMVILYSVWH